MTGRQAARRGTAPPPTVAVEVKFVKMRTQTTITDAVMFLLLAGATSFAQTASGCAPGYTYDPSTMQCITTQEQDHRQEQPPAQTAHPAAKRPRWPSQMGTYAATSSAAIPLFPGTLEGYRPVESGKDFWDQPFRSTDSLRVGEGDWQGIYQFPNTMNHCGEGKWMIRWRASSPVQIQSNARYSAQDVSPGPSPTSSFGYMFATNCEQPMFKVVGKGAIRGVPAGASLVVDIYYELKFWQAAP